MTPVSIRRPKNSHDGQQVEYSGILGSWYSMIDVLVLFKALQQCKLPSQKCSGLFFCYLWAFATSVKQNGDISIVAGREEENSAGLSPRNYYRTNFTLNLKSLFQWCFEAPGLV